MASKRKRGGKDVGKSMTPDCPMTKEQKSVTDWVRKNVPTKKTKFLQAHVVNYFVAAKAIDALLSESPWSKEKAKEGQELVFVCREQIVTYMDELLKQKMFHRAKKIPVQDKAKKSIKKDGNKTESEVEATPKPGGEQKKKRKIRLDMHLDQVFVDSTDAYVWLYDPISWVYWLGGTAIVLGTIAICLFPLWPPIMRQGVHYLSIGAAGFLLLIMATAIFKYVLFGALFLLSAGKLSFWLFPNLTEDLGFIESFLPIYDYTYTGNIKRKKDKDSDDEEEDDSEDEKSESDESTSKKSSTGKDFEMVDKNEDTADEEAS